HRNLCDRDEEAQDLLPAGPGPTMGFGHQANHARRWPAGRLSAPARATEGNALGKGVTNAHKTNGKEIVNSLEAVADGDWGKTALKLMTSWRPWHGTRTRLLSLGRRTFAGRPSGESLKD